jgi:hypothetical protein
MIAVLLLSLVFTGALFLLLARYGGNAAMGRAERTSSDRRPRMAPAQLRALVFELLDKLGLAVVEEELRGDQRRLVAARRPVDAFAASRFVVFVDATPPGDVVQPTQLVELGEYVRAERAQIGLFITPYEINRGGLAGMDMPIELIDGVRLRQIVAKALPERLAEIDRYRGIDEEEPRALRPEPA